jgi:hypothetical protein
MLLAGVQFRHAAERTYHKTQLIRSEVLVTQLLLPSNHYAPHAALGPHTPFQAGWRNL